MDISNWLFAAAVASNVTNRSMQRALVEGVVTAELDALGNTPREEWVPEGEILRREEELEEAFMRSEDPRTDLDWFEWDSSAPTDDFD